MKYGRASFESDPGAGVRERERKLSRPEAQRLFESHFVATGDYKAASRAAGVSDRTGRRWKATLSNRTELARGDGLPPPESTSFVGREAELTKLRELLDQRKRLVTLVGAPGIGKTRVAIQLADQALRGGCPVVFCDLRSANSRDDLCAELARVFDGGASPTDAVVGGTGDRIGELLALRGPCLVVLDNFEVLVDSAAAVVARWIREAPRAQFLVTSRRVLHVSGEQVFELGPLSSTATADVSGDALDLFLERAAAADSNFSVSSRDPDLRGLVERLQGIPLVIELAAAQLRRLSLSELAGELEETMLVMQASSPASRPAHTTVEAAIDRSWQLLEEWEQSALSQLSVFHQGFSSAAAQGVLRLPTAPGAVPPAVSEVLASLRDASLIGVEASSGGDSRRWSLCVAVRDFAASRLPPDQRSAVRETHARYFFEEGQRLVDGLKTPCGAGARITLAENQRDLEAAFEWLALQAEGGVHPDSASEAALMALVLFESVRRWMPELALRPLSDAIRWMERAREIREDLRCRLYLARAIVARDGASTQRADADFKKAEAVAADDHGLSAEVDCEAAIAELEQGRHGEARHRLERALSKVENRVSARHLEGRIRRYLARALAEAFLDPSAFAHYARATALLEEAGDECESAIARVSWCVHRVFFQRGSVDGELSEQLARTSRYREWLEEGRGRAVLGILRQEQGRFDEARECYQRAAELGRRTGSRYVIAYAMMRLGNCSDEQGDLADALLKYARAEEMFGTVGNARVQGLCRLYKAGVLARESDIEGARRCLADARDTFSSSATTGFDGLCDLQEAQIDLALARTAAAMSDSVLEGQRREAAEARMDAAVRPQKEGEAGAAPIRLPLAHTSPEARLLLRLLGRRRELAVWRDGEAFQVGTQRAVVLPPGRIIRGVLTVLVEQRMAAPGQPVATLDILRRCWPGERMRRESGVHRVRQAMHRLRRAGLQDVLLSRGEGYLLDPNVTVAWADNEMADASCDPM